MVLSKLFSLFSKKKKYTPKVATSMQLPRVATPFPDMKNLLIMDSDLVGHYDPHYNRIPEEPYVASTKPCIHLKQRVADSSVSGVPCGIERRCMHPYFMKQHLIAQMSVKDAEHEINILLSHLPPSLLDRDTAEMLGRGLQAALGHLHTCSHALKDPHPLEDAKFFTEEPKKIPITEHYVKEHMQKVFAVRGVESGRFRHDSR